MICPTKQYIWLCLTLLLLGTACSTNDDSWPSDNGRTATVRLHIPQLETAARTVTGTALENAIYTLRVIILSEEAVSINREFTSDELQGGSITLTGVPIGPAQMYVIANEQSIGKDYTELSTLQSDVDQSNKKLVIKDLNRKHFPKRGSVFEKEQTGLPMGWMNKTDLFFHEGEQTIDVNLERQVAKLNIIMYNTLTTPITVKSISFGQFFSDRFYFFREANLDIPDDTKYAEKTFYQVGSDNNGIEIAAGKTETMVCYIYPSFAWKSPTVASPYTIGFTTSVTSYDKQAFVNKYGSLNSITRNTQLNIYATLSRSSAVGLKFSVEPWTDVTITVPPFD